jgi:hypothetical protein
MPRLLLHIEGAALLAAALALYARQGFSWWSFLLFLLAPDLSMVGYALNPRTGSIVYNLVHTTVFPLALGLFGYFNGAETAFQAALIWLAHIGIDRTAGYGFKYAAGFKQTHFSPI